MSTVKVALWPKNEAPRRSGKTVRGTTNYINNSKTADSTAALRLQRLRLLGIIGRRAELIASIAWEAGA